MVVASYPVSCPGCGGVLRPVVLDATSAPWLCHSCSRGWWPSELSAAARAVWRAGYKDFGVGGDGRAIAEAVTVDVAAAAARGCSTLVEQLGVLDVGQLRSLADRPGVAAGFRAAVDGELTVRGG